MTTDTRTDYRRATFRAATRGMHPWRVAKTLNSLTSGVDWRGCSKEHMREAFAKGEHGLLGCTGNDLRAALGKA